MLFVTTLPVVWGVVSVSLYLSSEVHLGLSLIAVDLVLVNAFVHLVHAFIFRCYNPGLATALAMFVPLGIYTLRAVQLAGGGTVAWHALGAGIAVAIHAAILAHVHRRLRRGA